MEIDTVLVVAPKRVTENVWTSEIKKWKHLKHLKTSRIIGTAKQRKHALSVKADIYLISRDNIAWLIGLHGGSMLPYDMLVIDESSSFKNHKSQRFKALRNVQPSFNRVVLLTGTPAPNSLMDLWSQIYLLDRGKRLGKFITTYRQEFFREGRKNGHIVYNYDVLQDGEQRIYDKISDICMSMKAADYLDLPGRKDNFIDIYFPPALKQKYDDFEKEQVLEILEGEEEGEISAVNAAALSNKLLQFANGAIYDEERQIHEVHDLKIKEVLELMENSQGKPVLIAWTYRHDLYRLQKALKKYKPRQLKKESDIEEWNRGEIRVLLMHPASGGHGLNLQSGGNIIIWFGQTWSLELYQQFNARLDRQGQTEVTIIHHLISKGTLDEKVIAAQQRKEKKQNGLMEAVKAIKSRIKKEK